MSALEKHFTIEEIAALWHMAPESVRRLFKDRGDVVKFGHGERMRKRPYVSLRIPESTVQRVHAELRAKRAPR